ncbi:MAG: hypothetical protein KatS3mg071_0115 [Meiothermus sp.]|nr:MAG: hypothetical protein KatS3mg071_0115 [Meiothermus sp.]
MRYLLGILALLGLALGQALTPKSIIVNPAPPPDLQVRVWVDKDPNKTGNPVYQFGENIQISVQVTQPAYVYLFSVRATGEISGILPNAFEQENFLQAGEVRTFPGLGAPYTFTVEGPAGQDRVLAVASRRPLDVSEIVDIQTGRARIQGEGNLARALSIVVTPIPANDWVTDEAYYIAGQLPPPPPSTGTLSLNSSPSGAQALINGRLVGNTPLNLELLPGTYNLELRRSGYNPLRTAFTIQAGQVTRLNLTLVATPPPTGVLAVDSNPRGAQVLVNGRVVGNTPLNLTLNPGSYTVELRRGGFSPFRTLVTIQAGRTTRLTVNLISIAPPPPPVQPVQPVRPPSGSFTYTCQGGTLVVNYISSNQVRLFYDGAFQTLPLVRSGAELVYSNNVYTWEIGQVGRLIVRGQVVLSNCRI